MSVDHRELKSWRELSTAVENFIVEYKEASAGASGADLLLAEFVLGIACVPVDPREKFAAHTNVFASSTLPHHAIGLMAVCQAQLEVEVEMDDE